LGRALLAALLVAGCSGAADLLLPGDGKPATIRVVEGNGQSGRVGEPLTDPLVVKVTDSRGGPVEGATVRFEFIDGGPGAEIEPVTANTNVQGEADARVRLGTRMGAQTGEARVVASEGTEEPKTSFTVTALSENANGIAAVSGDGQSGPAGSTLADPLVVEVTDVFQNPISGVAINWTAEGGGSVSQASTTTDDQGRASVVRTLGPAAGQQTTLASSERLAGSPVTFTHTATAGTAAGLAVVSGNNQTAEVGTQLPADLVVRLTDEEGNPVEGAAVTWVVSIGRGSVTPENDLTDASGLASTRWTLGPVAGENRVDAVVSGVDFVSFNATGTSSAPDVTITTITSDSPDPSVVGAAITVGFRVTSNGPTPTGTVAVTVTDGGANCSGTLRDGTGGCQLTLNSPGDRTLRATYSGGPGLRGSSDTEPHRVESVAPPPRASTTTTIISDSPDPSDPGAAITVSFTVTSPSGTPSGNVQVTDSNGGTCTGSAPSGSCSYTPGGVGTRTITATYQGNSNFNGSSDSEQHTVSSPTPPPPQTLDLRVRPSSSAIIGEPFERQPEVQLRAGGEDVERSGVAVLARIASGNGTLAGTTTVTTDDNGRAEFTDLTINGATGPHTLTFSADGFGSVSSDAIEVRRARSQTRFTAFDPDEAVVGQPVRVEYEVEGDGGTPTGNVTVTADGPGESCTGSVADGFCTITFTTPGDPRHLTATYSGDARFDVSSANDEIEVDPAPPPPPPPAPAETETEITSDEPDASLAGEQVVVQFTVSPKEGSGTPTGTVVVTADGDLDSESCTASVEAGSCSITLFTLGSRTLTATYGGDASFAGSSDEESHNVDSPDNDDD
jgi:hypothetical protein